MVDGVTGKVDWRGPQRNAYMAYFTRDVPFTASPLHTLGSLHHHPWTLFPQRSQNLNNFTFIAVITRKQGIARATIPKEC